MGKRIVAPRFIDTVNIVKNDNNVRYNINLLDTI